MHDKDIRDTMPWPASIHHIVLRCLAPGKSDLRSRRQLLVTGLWLSLPIPVRLRRNRSSGPATILSVGWRAMLIGHQAHQNVTTILFSVRGQARCWNGGRDLLCDSPSLIEVLRAVHYRRNDSRPIWRTRRSGKSTNVL